jgi:hypothetical protein
MAISYSDYLLKPGPTGVVPAVGYWVGLVSNNTGLAYKSDTTTDAFGKFNFTVKPPGDTYTVYTSLTGTGLPPAGWVAFGDAAYAIPIVQGENPALQSGTFTGIGPYTSSSIPSSFNNEYRLPPPNGIDDTVNIQNAQDAIHSAAGSTNKSGSIVWQPGIYNSGKITFYEKTHNRGAGVDATLLLLVAGANSPLFQSQNFATLGSRRTADGVTTAGSTTLTSATMAFTAGDVTKQITGVGLPGGTTIAGYTNATTVTLSGPATFTASGLRIGVGTNLSNPGGPYHFSIRDMTFDGNRSNQTVAADLIQIYGSAFLLNKLRWRYSKGVGLYSEWSNYGGTPVIGGTFHGETLVADGMEAMVTDIKGLYCDGGEAEWNGPHDSTWNGGELIGNTPGGAPFGMRVGPNGGGVFWGIHSWGNHNQAWLLEGGGSVLNNCIGEGAADVEVQINQNDCSIVGGRYFASGIVNASGIRLGTAASVGAGISGIVDTKIFTQVSGHTGTGAGLDCIGDSGANMFDVLVYGPGTATKNGPSTASYSNIEVAGGGTGSNFNMPYAASFGGATVFTGALTDSVFSQTASGTVHINPQGANVQRITLNGALTSLVIDANPATGTEVELHLIQDGAGSRAISGLPASLVFIGGSTPTWSTAINARDVVKFRWDGANYIELARSVGNLNTKGHLVMNGATPTVDAGGATGALTTIGAPNGTIWNNNANSINNAFLTDAGLWEVRGQIYPGAEALGLQTLGGLLHSTGIPSNANGNNNDWCISDNGHFYFKTGAVWVQKI